MLNYKTLEHGQEIYKDFVVINWSYFNVCNYTCSYCTPPNYDGSAKGLGIDVAKNFIDLVFEQKKDKKIYFEFTGGESTYLPIFKELFSLIKAKGGFTGIISNGSRSLAWWKENGHLIDHVCLSFHAERGKQDHFYEVIAILSSHSTVHVNIMMMPERFDELYLFASKIAEEFSGVSLAIQPLFEKFSGPMFSYTDEQRALLENPSFAWQKNVLHRGIAEPKVFRGEMKKIYYDGTSEIADPTLLISREENSWFNWDCYAGVENLVIDPRGYITRGICRAGGIIGNIQDADFKFPEEPIRCLMKKCYCAFDIMCTKIKPLELPLSNEC